MPATLKVQTHRSTDRPRQSYALKVKAVEAEEMSPAIFIFQRPKTSPDGTREPDKFICVADAVDMEEVPELNPDLSDEMPYYRVDTVELVFRNLIDLDNTESDIKQDIADLVQSIAVMANMEMKEWTIVGGPYSGASVVETPNGSYS